MGRKYRQLTARDRVLISHFKARGSSLSEIARRVGVDKSTISRELRRNAQTISREEHLFWLGVRHLMTRQQVVEHLKSLGPQGLRQIEPTAHWSARSAQSMRNHRLWCANQVRRRKKLETRKWVIEKLKAHWSPAQIAGRSKIDGPEPVSHEYVYLLVKAEKSRGGTLHRYLKRYRKRKQRFGARDYPSGPVIPNRIGIEQRPKLVASRKRFGDLEADLIQGYRSSGYILSVIDRKSRYLILRKLKTKRKEIVRAELLNALKKLPISKTLTVDNGSEFCDHERLTELTGIPVYFTHPYCSTERGSIENANGLVRHFLPKKTCFAPLTQSRLNEIQKLLNNRPRECLKFLTPREVHPKNHRTSPVPALHL